jgi:hypothetical protein
MGKYKGCLTGNFYYEKQNNIPVTLTDKSGYLDLIDAEDRL